MKTVPPPDSPKKHTLIDASGYEQLYQESIESPEYFWRTHGMCIDWIRPYSQVMEYSFDPKNVYIKWFADGTLNASANCLDRHLPTQKDQIAIFWQGDNPADARELTYGDLHQEVCRFANALKTHGVQKGDRVAIYMPMIPEALVSMLACARIGAIHTVVFGGFSSEALAGRIQDSEAKILITANEGYRHGKAIPFKERADAAVSQSPVEKMIVVQRTKTKVNWDERRDLWYHEIVRDASEDCPPEELDAEQPLFILYTSGSTGTPKGVLHTTGGYMVYANLTFRYVFDYHDIPNPEQPEPNQTGPTLRSVQEELSTKPVYFCTADIGWITGHTYLLYGPLSAGATIILFEGVPDYPDVSRYWSLVEQYNVNILYTAPTVLRNLMRYGEEPVKKHNLDSLRLLGTVGEPCDPNSWEWYHSVVGQKKCPIVDTWWQTETGGIILTPLPGASTLKPGSVSRPFFGIQPELVDNDGNILKGEAHGNLVLTRSWPGQMRTVYNNHQRFVKTYFSQVPGSFFTDDQARRDADGDYWITGRLDDVIKVSGHRLGTADIESALMQHPEVAEAAVIGVPHKIKGQCLYLFVIPAREILVEDTLKNDLTQWLRKKIGPIATPDFVQWTQELPKTRSGKVMRRILRKIATGAYDDLGDTSTLSDPSVIEDLIKNRILSQNPLNT